MSTDHRTIPTAESLPPPRPTFWPGFLRRTVPTFLVVLAICYAVYGHVHITFMRAESGMMLAAAQTRQSAAEMIKFAATTSYAGHYVPLFFALEIAASKVCGISEPWWRAHQLIGITVLIMALLSFFDAAARMATADKLAQLGIKVALTAPIVFSPLMIEFVSWPFEMGQIIWATLTVLSLTLLTRSIVEGKPGQVSIRALSFSLVCAYGSIHAFGLGAVTLAGWFAVWAVFVLDGWLSGVPKAYLRQLALVGAAGVLLTVVHGSLMLFLPRHITNDALANLSLRSYLGQTLGYLANLLWQSLRSLGGADAWPYPRPDYVGKDWVYGLGFILLMWGGAVALFRAYRDAPSTQMLSRACWQLYAAAAFCGYVGMVSLRIRHQGESWLGYLLGPRYLWPSELLLFGFFASFAACFRLAGRRLAVALGMLVVGTAAGGNIAYQLDVVPTVWPWLNISHERTWHEIAAMAGELHKNNLPLPNLSLEKLGNEQHPLLKKYEPMLRRLAGIRSDEPLRWVYSNEITLTMWQEMKSKSPAFARLSDRIFAEEENKLQKAVAESAEEARRDIHGASLLDKTVLKEATLDHVKGQPNFNVGIAVNGITHRAIWINSPTALTYRHISLGVHPVLHVYITIHPYIYTDDKADGATFQVSVSSEGKTEQLASVYCNPIANPDWQRWTPLDVDLAKYAGKTVDLTLSNGPGPADNDYADWCLWGDPVLSD